MFRCDYCHKTAPANTSENKVTLETRAKVYPERKNEEGEIIDAGGVGEEIVREAKVCDSCLKVLNAKLEEQS